jgi:hypothetical protein
MSKVIVLVIAVLGAAAILILGYGADGDAYAFSARTERAVVADNSNPENRKQKITAVDSNPTPDALERKDRSIARLRSEGVPVIEHLPAIEAESQVVRRSLDDVAYRALVLLVVALKAEGLEQPLIEHDIARYRLIDHLSPLEQAFLQDPAPAMHDRIQFSWRYEAAYVLLWALGYVDELEKPTSTCDVAGAVSIMTQRSLEQFLSDATLRSVNEILDEADLIYRYHWAVVDARVNGRPAPAGLNPGVTLERHHALNWLIGYMDQEWDEISTDT